MKTRLAGAADAEAVCGIYNQGVAERLATFETEAQTPAQIEARFDGRHPSAVVEENGQVTAFASTSIYRPRACSAGIAEFLVYVDPNARGRGAGRAAMQTLIQAAENAGHWKLVSRAFVEDAASRALLFSLGFREVGIYERHSRLDGYWRDCVIVERLLSAVPPDEETK